MIAELPVGLNYQDHSTVFRNVFFENLKISKEEHFYKRNLLTTKAMIDYFIKGEGSWKVHKSNLFRSEETHEQIF